jgi:hypothetical protein
VEKQIKSLRRKSFDDQEPKQAKPILNKINSAEKLNGIVRRNSTTEKDQGRQSADKTLYQSNTITQNNIECGQFNSKPGS